MQSLYEKEVKKSSFKVWDQNPLKQLPVSDIIKMYENGFAGSICSEEAEEELLSQVSFKYGSDVCDAFGYAESAAGKLVVPFTYIDKFYGKNRWLDPAQGVGNCFLSGTMVTMADGSKKPIEQISIGEKVVSHKGKQKVYELIEKNYNDNLVEFKSRSFSRSIKSTKDHKYPILKNKNDKNLIWKTADEINVGDWLILGKPRIDSKDIIFDLKQYGADITDDIDFAAARLEPVSKGYCRTKHSKTEIPRYIKFNEKFAYILGAYLAEGTCERQRDNLPIRIKLSLNSNETTFQKVLIKYIKDVFNIDAQLYKHSDSVTQIRFSNKAVANLINSLCGDGNVYSKSPPWQALGLEEKTKLALIQGWMDGDGWYSDYTKDGSKTYYSPKAIAVSASKNLVIGMQELANSCGLKCSIITRPAYKQSKESYSLNFYSNNAVAVKKQTFTQNKIEVNNCEYGIPVQIKEKNYIPYKGKVYCINVEKDHSFIADGFLTHNCVSRGQTYANLTTLVSEVYYGQPDAVSGYVEELPKDNRTNKNQCPLACEPVYWFRGHNGHGWYCAASTQVSIDYTGAIPRINIDGVGDFTKYDEQLGVKYGRSKPPSDVIEKINNNLFREATKVDSFESLRELLYRGFGVNTCGSEGFSSKRDEYGVSRRQGSWAHSMAFIGCDDRDEIRKIYKEPLVLVLNSWGSRWNSGPTKIYGTNIDIPEGSFWARWSDVKNRDMYAIAGLSGWARKELPDLSPGAI